MITPLSTGHGKLPLFNKKFFAVNTASGVSLNTSSSESLFDSLIASLINLSISLSN